MNVRLLLILLHALVDCVVASILFTHGGNLLVFLEILNFRIHSSWFDVWCCSIVRCSLVFGSCIAFCNNRTDSAHRLAKLQILFITFGVACYIFVIIKLLLVAESSTTLALPWMWCLFSWTILESFLLPLQLAWLRRSPPAALLAVNGVNSVNATQEEQQRLLDGETSDEEETKGKGTSFFRLFSYSRPDLHFLLFGFLFLAVAALGEVFIPYYTGKVIDSIVIDRDSAQFTTSIFILVGISATSAVASGIRGGIFSITIARLNIRIRNLLFQAVVQQEIGFFDETNTGDVTSRLSADTTTMSDTVSLNLNIFLRSMIKAVGVIVFMFKLSWRLTMVTFIGTPIIFAVSKLYGKYYKKLSKEVQDTLADANQVAEEVCSTMKTVRSFASENEEAGRYNDMLAQTYRLKRKQAFIYACWMWSNQIFELALTVGILYYGGHLVLINQMTGGTLVSFILYQLNLGDCIDSMGNVYTGLMSAVGASTKVFEYMDRKPRISHSEGKLRPEQFEGRIEFRGVHFGYPTRPDTNVLKEVSFAIQPGEVVALVGPSGGGKTSCINLIERFYEPLQGEILLDGHRVQQFDHPFLHNRIALVSQEPVLYARSVRENIAYGAGPVTSAQVEEAAKLANAHDFIMKMKDQYETLAGEKGTQLSGGQKQRIAIARALIRRPAVLLLDEATSALDTESESLVQEALHKNMLGRTVLIIAHRLSTIQRADRILVIDQGSIVEQGSPTELLRLDGVYARLVRKQLACDELFNQLKTASESCSPEFVKKVKTLKWRPKVLDEVASQRTYDTFKPGSWPVCNGERLKALTLMDSPTMRPPGFPKPRDSRRPLVCSDRTASDESTKKPM